MAKRQRILLLAPYADPKDVGESLSTFRWVEGLAQHHEVTVLAIRRHGATDIRDYLPGVDVTLWTEPAFLRRHERINSMLKPGYVKYYFAVRRWIKQALRSGRKWDLVHQIAPLAPRYPCPALGFGMPVVLGPIGGSQPTPPGMQEAVGAMAWYTRFRALDTWRYKYDPWLHATLTKTDMILAVSPLMASMLPPSSSRQVRIMPETGVPELPEIDLARRSTSSDRCRMLYVGRIVRTKGLRDAIQALAELKSSPGAVLDVVGDGDDRKVCETLVQELGLGSQVIFHGKQPRAKVDEYFRSADVFVFPSFRETTGNVLMEAQSFGLPILTADYAGPGYVVDEHSGIRVPPTNPAEFAHGIATAMRTLLANPELRLRMSACARQRVEREFLWPKKVPQVCAWYETLLAPVTASVQQPALA
ncbi:MAG: glycosyltransferase family 4 protein [Phycisphaerae bacterium]